MCQHEAGRGGPGIRVMSVGAGRVAGTPVPNNMGRHLTARRVPAYGMLKIHPNLRLVQVVCRPGDRDKTIRATHALNYVAVHTLVRCWVDP